MKKLMGLAAAAAAGVLAFAGTAAAGEMSIVEDAAARRYTVMDGCMPVLTYNFGTVSVPEDFTCSKGNRRYARPRGDYVHPLYNARGQIITHDFRPEEPHHRGIFWSWPEVGYKGEIRDFYALQNGFHRPVRMIRKTADGKTATLEAQSQWMWDDREPIVDETVKIVAGPLTKQGRAIDFTLTLRARKEGVTVARRRKTEYGGICCRMGAFDGQAIASGTADAGLAWPGNWGRIGGSMDGHRTDVVILPSAALTPYVCNWKDYPNLHWQQFLFPHEHKPFPLPADRPLTIAWRIVVRDGAACGTPPEELCKAYAKEQEKQAKGK